jgi:frataxin-like iron-binding protein CyaY|tara:strand:+ start:44 stop:235 length:192 start_codon:yes stop_codon:yes gene_type:complete
MISKRENINENEYIALIEYIFDWLDENIDDEDQNHDLDYFRQDSLDLKEKIQLFLEIGMDEIE